MNSRDLAVSDRGPYHGAMADFPLLLRYRDSDGVCGPKPLADNAEQARSFLAEWRKKGYTSFTIEDVDGQPVVEATLGA